VNQALAEYRFDEAANTIYQFFWGDFCDWYLEIVKLRLDFGEAADKDATRSALATLIGVFESALRMLSPFMPFITEEIWHALYDQKAPAASIALTRYPQPVAEHIDPVAELEMAEFQKFIVAIRAQRKEKAVPDREAAGVYVENSGVFQESFVYRLILSDPVMVGRLARAKSFVDVSAEDRLGPMGGLGWREAGPTYIAIDPGQAAQVDFQAESERFAKDLAKYEKEMESKRIQLGNEAFLAKAPPQIVEGLKRRADELAVLIEKTRATLDNLESQV
jgi:valyl-tRNA synthetase